MNFKAVRSLDFNCSHYKKRKKKKKNKNKKKKKKEEWGRERRRFK